MRNYPKYAEVNGERYKINTDYRVGIDCYSIALDESIGDYERALAIIYKLFGDKGLEDEENHEKLLEIAKKFLSCGEELEETNEKDIDMDLEEDLGYIKASFRSDYRINLDTEEMHWWEFYELLGGLSNSELGNCCILNRIRNLRNMDETKIEDDKIRKQIHDAKKKVAIKRYQKQEFTQKEIESYERLMELAKLR